MNTSLIAFAVGLIASMGLTVPACANWRCASAWWIILGPRKVHVQPMPLLGGLAIYLGVLVALLVTLGGSALTQVIGIYAGATLVAVVGILDDRGLLHHQIKLFGAMPAAAVILLLSGIRAQVFSNIWPGAPGVWSTWRSRWCGSWASPHPSASWITWTGCARALPPWRRCSSQFLLWKAVSFWSAPWPRQFWEPPPVSCAGISSPPKFSWAMAAQCSSASRWPRSP